jgi:tetratricopeptide (TPR) repeat protein
MRTVPILLLLLVAGARTGLEAQSAPASDYLRVLRWIEAARTHRPGVVDVPLQEVSAWGAQDYQLIRLNLTRALAQRFSSPAERDDVIRRGILLHTDIALLLPERAATFHELPASPPDPSRRRREERRSTQVAAGFDGQFVDSGTITAHWLYARLLARELREPAKDPFVSAWYRATAAWFEAEYLLGFAEPHLAEALSVFPGDPWLQFYRGALYEALAAPRYQNIARSGPELRRERRTLAAPATQLLRAEGCFRRAVALDPEFAEARLRLGHVLFQRGAASEALVHVRQALSNTRDPIVMYFGQLFAGAAFEALNRRAEAASAFKEAAAIAPTAQTPLLALSALARRFDDRQAALTAFERLASLPTDSAERIDPWWNYLRSFAWNAEELLQDLRRPFLR